MEGLCPDKLCGALQTLFHERSCDGKMHLISATFLVKMVERNARRRSDIPKFKTILPLRMPKAYAVGILNRFVPRGLLHKAVWQSLFALSR